MNFLIGSSIPDKDVITLLISPTAGVLNSFLSLPVDLPLSENLKDLNIGSEVKVIKINNRLYISKNTSYMTYILSSTSSQVGETCYNMGYLTSTDYINITEYAVSGTSSPVISFRLEVDNNVSTYDIGYRYEGPNPNNYIMFNNELWRIIGVFDTEYDSNKDGTIDESDYLVKLIRNESIGGLAWNKSGNSKWEYSSLYHLLNEQYYDWENNKNNVSTYCYVYNDIVQGNCDYSVNGIHDKYRNMIINAKWYLGGGGKSGFTTYTFKNVYDYERNANAIYSYSISSYLGYVGLMYESDYLYAALLSDCIRTTTHGSYNNNNCAGKNWLFNGEEYTITPNSSISNYIWSIFPSGLVSNNYTSSGSYVRPVVYLSSLVYKVTGTGTNVGDKYEKNNYYICWNNNGNWSNNCYK